MNSKVHSVKKLFSEELKRCCVERYRKFPSNEKLARDLAVSSQYSIKVSRETVRKWLKGDTFPDLDCLLHLIEWLELDMSNIFLNSPYGSDKLLIKYNKNLSDNYFDNDLNEEKIALFNQALNVLINIGIVEKKITFKKINNLYIILVIRAKFF